MKKEPFYEFFWIIFEFWAKMFRTFSKSFSANTSTLHSTHPDSFFEMKDILLFFLIEKVFPIFFQFLVVKFENSVGKFQQNYWCCVLAVERGKKNKKLFLKTIRKFFRILNQKNFGILAKFFSRDFGNAFHVSGVPFREKFLFGEINLLMDRFANCAVGIKILMRTSQHGCQNYNLAVRRHSLSFFELTVFP